MQTAQAARGKRTLRNDWSDAEAAALVRDYAARGVGEDLALRTYTSRLLGRVPRLVMHGGGNTSVKTRLPDLFGDPVDVLCVKGSGRDLATIEPDGHPAVRLAPLFRLRTLERLSDEEMVNVQRQNLLDTAAPNPSVETLLHAWLPHRFVDHTHAVTATAIAAQPDAEALCRRLFGGRMGFVPYIMPGFALARAAADVFDADPSVEALLLAKHGLFTFGDTAREAYDRMIAFVTAMEDHVRAAGRAPAAAARVAPSTAPVAALLPRLRGVIGARAEDGARHRVLHHRTGDAIRHFVDGAALASIGTRGVATPEQVIRIKRVPALLPPVPAADDVQAIAAWADAAADATDRFVADYETYFARGNARAGGTKRPLDPLPRVLAVPGFGIVTVGRDATEAAVAADVAEAWIEAVIDAERIGTFQSISADEHFDMEYWSLEQAKLGRAAPARLAGRVALVTGAAGAIGAEAARAFAGQGAAVVLVDRDEAKAAAIAAAIGRGAEAIGADLTDAAAVRTAFAHAAARFGGVDIVLSNAGAAMPGPMATLDDATLAASFAINFFAHQTVAQEAVRIFGEQRLGGVLLFNASKQAVQPGPDFGAYGTSKAALLALVRQYALEHGRDGIRVNAVNADRIRSGLLDDAMIRGRAEARGISEDAYMRGNLLGLEVRARDVAEAFVAASLLERTTGHVITVDGGNVAAMLR